MPPRLARFVKIQRTAWIIIGFAMLACAAVFAQVENRERIAENKALSTQVRAIAIRADARAQYAIIQDTLQRQKVCSTTLANQREACRDLFERLVRNVSRRQRFRLACSLMYELKDPVFDMARRRAGCPPPTPPPS